MTFIPAHRLIGSPTAPHLAFVLHGALGSAQNWVSFTKALAERTPRVRYALVDLRGHGASLHAPPPHGLTAAAGDLAALGADLGASPVAVIGHSLGGKVALEHARLHPGELAAVWCLDSNPGAQRGAAAAHEVYRVLAAVRSVRQPVASRQVALEALRAQGLSAPIASWLGTSLRRDLEGYRFTFDFGCLEQLVADYFAVDCWGYVHAPRERPTVHLVVAAQSRSWTPGFREQVEQLRPTRGLVPHVLPDSGHWVHIDNPAGLLGLMAPVLAAL